MEHQFSFGDFAKGVMSSTSPRKKDLERRFDELEAEYADADERELARQFAMETLAASRRQTLDILEQHHRFAFEGEIPF